MSTSTKAEIQRQYDEVISKTYDTDPQGVTNSALDRALDQLTRERYLSSGLPMMNVLDVGLGTGLFYQRLRQKSQREIRPCGLDVSEKMVAVAKNRVPDLVAAIDDAAKLDQHFTEESFDLVATHFVTGFVPFEHIAPQIYEKLKPGGYWSFCGGTKGSFPNLQSLADNRFLRAIFARGQNLDTEELLVPKDQADVERRFQKHGFEICQSETFEPSVKFGNFDEFMDFAYRGSWLTAFIEAINLQNAGWFIRTLANRLVFPLRDHHSIVISLVRRRLES